MIEADACCQQACKVFHAYLPTLSGIHQALLALQGQQVQGVVEVSDRAVMLLTAEYVAMLKTSSPGPNMSFKPKWAIRICNIQTVRGMLTPLSLLP